MSAPIIDDLPEYTRRLIKQISALEAHNQQLREALTGVIPYMEAAENAGLVGHEGCHWPVEKAREALAATEEP